VHDHGIRHRFDNAATLISFRVGAEDAGFLAREFQPKFEVEDLINLPNRNIYLKLMIDGTPSQPFSAWAFNYGDMLDLRADSDLPLPPRPSEGIVFLDGYCSDMMSTGTSFYPLECTSFSSYLVCRIRVRQSSSGRSALGSISYGAYSPNRRSG
jgi:hypothetical protein